MPTNVYVDLHRRFVDHDKTDLSTLTMRMLGSGRDHATIGSPERAG